MTIGNIVTKLTGLTGLYLVGKDAHKFGIAGKNRNPKDQVAKEYPDMYIDTQRLDSDTLMVPTAQFKKMYMNYCLEDTTMPVWHAITGYISGVTKALTRDVIPLSLSIGALAMSKTDKFSKAGAKLTNYSILKKHGGKLCAALLALGAVKMLMYDVFDIGHYKKI